MSKKSRLLAGLGAAAVVLFALASRAWAEGPHRVQRIMLVWGSTVPLDWEAEGAVAMVVMPQKKDLGLQSFVNAIDEDWYGNVNYSGRMYEAIVSTLQANLAERNLPDSWRTSPGFSEAFDTNNRPVSPHREAGLTGRSLRPGTHGPRVRDGRRFDGAP